MGTIDFDAETITFTGSDTGNAIGVGGGDFLAHWVAFVNPEEDSGNFIADLVAPAFTLDSAPPPGFSVNKNSFDVEDAFTTDSVGLSFNFSASSGGTNPITLSGSNTPLDFSAWQPLAKQGLHEILDAGGVLPVAFGSGFSPITISSSAVPEPSSAILLGFATAVGCLAYRRRQVIFANQPEPNSANA